MALIPFPTGVPIVRSDLELIHPGQTVLRSLYGAGSQALSRGPGYWRGRLELAETDRASEGLRRAVELFLARLRGLENIFEAPIERPAAGVPINRTNLTVGKASNQGGVVTVTVDGAASGLLAGDYVRIGGRLYQLATDHLVNKFAVEPPLAPITGQSIVWENVTCLARLTGEGRARGARTPDFSGPWTIEWEEAI